MMKKLLSAALAVLLILSLSACGGKEKTGNTKLPIAQSGGSGTDFQKNMAGGYSNDIDKMCETESGYYLGYDAFVFYVDKKARAQQFSAISRNAATGTTSVMLGLTDIASPPTTASSIITAPILWRKRAVTKIWATCFALWSLTAQSTMWCSRWNLP